MKAWLRSRRFRWMLVLLLAVLAIAIIGFLSLPWLLIAPSQTPPSDVILHYAISPATDADEYVAQLYRQNVAKKIVCIGKAALCEIYPSDYARQHLIELGVPAEDVLTLHLPNADCLGPQISQFITLMKSHGWQKAIFVIRPLASRTEGNLVTKHFAQEGLGLAVTYAPGERQSFTSRWWAGYETAQSMTDAVVNGLLDPLYPECR